MDLITIVFVFSLSVVGLLLTVTIRRDIKAKESLRRDLERQTLHAHARATPPDPPRTQQHPIDLDGEDVPREQLTQ